MLSSILRSPRAIQVNIDIMRAFVRLRQLISSNKELAIKFDDLQQKYDAQFKLVFETIRQLVAPVDSTKKRQIGFIWNDEKGR